MAADMAASWAPSLAQAFVGLACDLALVLDPEGRICSVSMPPGAAPGLVAASAGWVGRPWASSVSADSQPKAQAVLADVARDGRARRREMTLATDPPAPMAFAALRLGPAGPTLLLGQDLRAAATLQQRFLLAQRDLEEGYQIALDQLAQRPPAIPPAAAAAAIASLLPAAARLLAPDGADTTDLADVPGPTAPAPARQRVRSRSLRSRAPPRQRR